MKGILLLAVLALAACSTPAPVVLERLPVQAATCADPENRLRLGEKSTFRDLAASRAEALSGWEECWNAARENADALNGQGGA